MKLIYDVKDKPSFGKVVIFALQQLLAILAATIAVPTIVQNGMSQSAALFGAGIGTLVYLLFTKFRSPVFLGSSFAFIGSMLAAFAGAVSAEAGHAGLIIGAACSFISARRLYHCCGIWSSVKYNLCGTLIVMMVLLSFEPRAISKIQSAHKKNFCP